MINLYNIPKVQCNQTDCTFDPENTPTFSFEEMFENKLDKEIYARSIQDGKDCVEVHSKQQILYVSSNLNTNVSNLTVKYTNNYYESVVGALVILLLTIFLNLNALSTAWPIS